MPVRVLIVDDNDAIRRGIRALLTRQADWSVCGEAANGLEATEMARRLLPDIVLMDMSMPLMDGAEATRIVRRELPEVEVIIVSQNDVALVRQQAVQVGAHRFVSKSKLARDLVPAIQEVIAGRAPNNSGGGAVVDVAARLPSRQTKGDGEQLLRMAETAAEIGTWEWDPINNSQMLSPELHAIFGTDAGDANYVEKWISRIHPGDRQRVQQLMQEGQRSGSMEFEYRYHHPELGLRWFYCKGRRIRDESPMFGLVLDVTERKRTDDALRQSEQRFRDMIDALPAAIYTTDAAGRLTHFNPAAVELSGRVPDLGSDQWCVTWKLIRADGTPLPHDECPMAIALKEGRCIDGIEAIAERPDGTRIWFVPYPRVLRDAEGHIIGGINMLVDITERKQAEQAGKLLAAIVDSSDDAIVSKNLDGMVTSWNKGAERIFGYSAEEAVGRNISLIIPPERQEEEKDILARLRRGERVDHFETIRRKKDGTPLNVSVTISPIRDATGRVTGASKVARDTTEGHRAEENYRKLAESLDAQVRARTKELEERNADVLRQSLLLRELSWRLLHLQDEERRHIARELHDSAGQTLAVLGVNLAALAKKAKVLAPEIAETAEKSQALVEQLTNEIRTTSYLLHPPLLDESGLPAALSWYFRGLKERSGLEISLDISKHIERFPRELELMVFRLIQECVTNIHRHSGSKRAMIQILREPDRIVVEVRDQGKGMPPERLAHIQSNGSGVGIRGMRERLRQFNGEMTIDSNGTGTTIRVTIPASKAAGGIAKSATQTLQSAD